MTQKELSNMIKPLLDWYTKNRRILPWREEKNPYYIWVSEIMLQQTRIEAVKDYYQRFIRELPTIQELAEVKEERLLKLWEGLGYYNRARNLKKAAEMIIEQYHGNMPKTYKELILLPGIGEYTAGAIASIAYNEKISAVDGNVLRVISRIMGSKKDILLPATKKEVTNMLTEIMPEEAGTFNEALMELGETICIPNGEPFCNTCPLQESCIAKQRNLTSEIPVRNKKQTRRKEERTVFIIYHKEKIAIHKREKTGLLSGMYEFPNLQTHLSIQGAKAAISNWELELEAMEQLKSYKHIFSHVEWEMTGYLSEVKNINHLFQWVSWDEIIEKYPIPTAFEGFYKQIQKKGK